MFINKDIPENDKIILNNLGKSADTPISQLLSCTKYRRESSIYNRIRKLRRENYLFGPLLNVNYNAIGRNKLYSIFVFAEYEPAYKEVALEAVKRINCWIMIYPVRTARVYLSIFRCNNWNYIATLFGLMKKYGWLKSYSVHKSEHQWMVQNPDFFGNFLPSQNYQIPQDGLPRYHFEDLEIDFEFTKSDLVVLKHASAKTCSLTEMRNLEYRYYGLKLKYHDLKRSLEKLKNFRILLEKYFILFPLPLDLCSLFFLVSRGKNFGSHLKTIANFGKDLRLNKTLIVVGKDIISYFLAYPLLEGRILGLLEDSVDAEIYGIKTYPSSELLVQTLNDDFFELNAQKWIFPFSKFEEEIKKLKEKTD